MSKMDWVDKREEENKEAKGKDYFDIVEGDNKFFMLTHAAPQALKWTGTKYEPAEEGDTGISIKGVCWVLQEGTVKLAKLPYTAIKLIRGYQNDGEWDLGDFPWEHQVTLNAKNAGQKEVEYTLTLSPKKTKIPQEALTELAKKPSPEDMVEKLKGKVSQRNSGGDMDHTDNAVDPSDLPF